MPASLAQPRALSCRRASRSPGPMTYLPDETDPSGAPASGERAGSRRALGCAFEIVETLVLTLLIYLRDPQLRGAAVRGPAELDGPDHRRRRVHPHRQADARASTATTTATSSSSTRRPGPGWRRDGIPFIKRIIGMPGDTISLENGRVFVTRPGESPVRIEEPYVVKQEDGTTAPTDLPARRLPADLDRRRGRVLRDGRQPPDRARTRASSVRSTRTLILGRAWLRYFPLERIGLIERPEYPALTASDD